jgi:hypothetical protein
LGPNTIFVRKRVDFRLKKSTVLFFPSSLHLRLLLTTENRLPHPEHFPACLVALIPFFSVSLLHSRLDIPFRCAQEENSPSINSSIISFPPFLTLVFARGSPLCILIQIGRGRNHYGYSASKWLFFSFISPFRTAPRFAAPRAGMSLGGVARWTRGKMRTWKVSLRERFNLMVLVPLASPFLCSVRWEKVQVWGGGR